VDRQPGVEEPVGHERAELEEAMHVEKHNAIGVAIFGAFVLMGQRTGVTQMVLSRSALAGTLTAPDPLCRPTT